MLAMTALSLIAATAYALADPVNDQSGQWWIRFSTPEGVLDKPSRSSVGKIRLSLDAFPKSNFIVCSTHSLAGLGGVRRANVAVALADSGVSPARVRNEGECGPEFAGEAFQNDESVLVIMQRVEQFTPSAENPALRDNARPYRS